MKRVYLLIMLISVTLTGANVKAQKNVLTDRFSIDGGGSFLVPASPTMDGQSLRDYAGVRGFYLGANYEFTSLIGLRLTYNNNLFQDKNNTSMGVRHHKIALEATSNVLQWTYLKDMSDNDFELLLHGGFGFAFGKSKTLSDVDKMGVIQFGLMPKYNLTPHFSVHLDASLVSNLKQNYYYNGVGFEKDKSKTGQYFMLNLGVGYQF